MVQDAALQKISIALIEDDEDDYVIIQDYLHEFRWAEASLEWADNYDDGLALMSENRHAVYLLDYRLGNETGLDLLRAAAEKGCKGPVIVLTGQDDRRVDLAVMESGAVDYLVKERIDAEMLERAIRYAIYRKRSELELAELQRRLADSREQERLSLAREIHDGPLQEVLGLRLHIGAVANEIPSEMAPRIDQILQQLQHAADILRNLCGELRPPALSPFGLEQAIYSYVQQFRSLHDTLEIEMDLDEDNQQLSESTRLALYRIFQNAMTNIAKHAQARRVTIQLQIGPQQIVLQIKDDGRGFTVPSSWMTIARRGHYGLLGAAERAESIGGRLLVHSEPGRGATVIAIAPRHFLMQPLQSDPTRRWEEADE
ncbi:MAG: response regulator [Caldilineaceae bacterium]|nr:response regulator [Caldilineaceae bacterium]